MPTTRGRTVGGEFSFEVEVDVVDSDMAVDKYQFGTQTVPFPFSTMSTFWLVTDADS